MAQANLPDPIFIARPAALQRLADELQREPIIAVDTESNSLYVYYERVCLIQFSTPRQDYLVDPLALQDLSPLRPIFASQEIEKVFHAAEYDVICLKRDFQLSFNRLFDTMIAARILGHDNLGLGSILRAEFGVQVDKRHQRANWGQRPLPPHLMAYAQLDTHYLINIRHRLHNELVSKSLWQLACEDFKRLQEANERANWRTNWRASWRTNDKNNDCWRINGASELDPVEAAVLRELCQYREQAARQADLPLFKIMGDKILLAIAARKPREAGELARIPGMSALQMKRHGKALLAAIQRGLNSPPLYPPRQRRPDESYLARLEALKEWRKRTARRMGVNSDVVLPRDLLHAIAEQNPPHAYHLGEIMEEVPWRLATFGEEILYLLERID